MQSANTAEVSEEQLRGLSREVSGLQMQSMQRAWGEIKERREKPLTGLSFC